MPARPWSVRLVALVALVALSGCATITGAATTTTTTGPVRAVSSTSDSVDSPVGVDGSLATFYQTPDPLPPGPPGAVIRSMVIPSGGLLPNGAVAYRILYHSLSLTGADIAVSGMVVVPGGPAPASGFPIVSWAHGTTGLADECAPSVGGYLSIPLLSSLLDNHDIVAATDYEGLGTAGIHPYLVGQSEAQGVLDAARAARSLVGPSASNKVAVLGYSQGGQAALFASQIAASYAPELSLAGAASVSPVTSLDEFVPAGADAGGDQTAVYAVMALDAWSDTYGNLSLSSELTPAALRHASTITTECSGPLAAEYDSTAAAQLFAQGWAQNASLQSDVVQNEPGRFPTATPLLVVEGTMDTLTPYSTVSTFVSDALCRSEDDTVQYLTVAGAGHDGAMVEAEPAIQQWLEDRLGGKPPSDTCSR